MDLRYLLRSLYTDKDRNPTVPDHPLYCVHVSVESLFHFHPQSFYVYKPSKSIDINVNRVQPPGFDLLKGPDWSLKFLVSSICRE